MYKLADSPEALFFLQWFIIIIIWGMSLVAIISDRKMLDKILVPEDIGLLLRLLFQRNTQFFTLITLLMVIIGIHDWPQDLAEPALVPEAITVPLPAAKVDTQPAPALPKINLSSPMPFLDIPEFNEKNGHEQAYIDFLKQRYEAWFITYYYLHKCNQTNADDFSLISTSLHNALAALHAPSDAESNIQIAALGSYQEMYKNITCDPPSITSSKASYLVNMQQLRDKSAVSLKK